VSALTPTLEAAVRAMQDEVIALEGRVGQALNGEVSALLVEHVTTLVRKAYLAGWTRGHDSCAATVEETLRSAAKR
jgi:hypothetical protein